jgi:hypothetical protein
MQGFMGLGQGPTPSAASGQRGSPETYKSYAAPVKDVPGSGVGQGVAGVAQARAGVQQPGQQGGFYGSNRFTGSGGASGGSQSQAQPHQHQQHHQPQAQGGQHLGYQQGAGEGNFYSYQPRGQQGYWQ